MKSILLSLLLFTVAACSCSVSIDSREMPKPGDCIARFDVKTRVPSWKQKEHTYKIVNREVVDRHMWYLVSKWDPIKNTWGEDSETFVQTLFMRYQKVDCPR